MSTEIPYGYCHCGCGERTLISTQTSSRDGWIKGEPRRFLTGHHNRLRLPSESDYTIEDRGHTTPCWVWQRGCSGPYGRWTINGEKRGAHVVMYERHRGPVPQGLVLDHLCRVTTCVNPDHLEPVTDRENVLRGVGLSAENARKKHCKRGHALDGENLYIASNGSRQCRTCRRERHTRWQRERRAALREQGR